MNKTLIVHHISEETFAKILVLFGGSLVRRDQVIQLLQSISGLSIYGTLSEEEGLQKIETLEKFDFVLIGGRSTAEQRLRIKTFLREHNPDTITLEPGIDIPYQEQSIYNHVKTLVK